VNEIYHYALKLLERRDYSEKQLRRKLEDKFGDAPRDIIDQLLAKRFLNDRRFAENFLIKHAGRHSSRIREALEEAGVASEIIVEAMSSVDWPSLREVLKARMSDWHLHPPLQRREAGRLFRALSRLGYPEDEIREELEQLHEQ